MTGSVADQLWCRRTSAFRSQDNNPVTSCTCTSKIPLAKKSSQSAASCLQISTDVKTAASEDVFEVLYAVCLEKHQQD